MCCVYCHGREINLIRVRQPATTCVSIVKMEPFHYYRRSTQSQNHPFWNGSIPFHSTMEPFHYYRLGKKTDTCKLIYVTPSLTSYANNNLWLCVHVFPQIGFGIFTCLILQPRHYHHLFLCNNWDYSLHFIAQPCVVEWQIKKPCTFSVLIPSLEYLQLSAIYLHLWCVHMFIESVNCHTSSAASPPSCKISLVTSGTQHLTTFQAWILPGFLKDALWDLHASLMNC